MQLWKKKQRSTNRQQKDARTPETAYNVFVRVDEDKLFITSPAFFLWSLNSSSSHRNNRLAVVRDGCHVQKHAETKHSNYSRSRLIQHGRCTEKPTD